MISRLMRSSLYELCKLYRSSFKWFDPEYLTITETVACAGDGLPLRGHYRRMQHLILTSFGLRKWGLQVISCSQLCIGSMPMCTSDPCACALRCIDAQLKTPIVLPWRSDGYNSLNTSINLIKIHHNSLCELIAYFFIFLFNHIYIYTNIYE